MASSRTGYFESPAAVPFLRVADAMGLLSKVAGVLEDMYGIFIDSFGDCTAQSASDAPDEEKMNSLARNQTLSHIIIAIISIEYCQCQGVCTEFIILKPGVLHYQICFTVFITLFGAPYKRFHMKPMSPRFMMPRSLKAVMPSFRTPALQVGSLAARN